jgi:hypothetical protein
MTSVERQSAPPGGALSAASHLPFASDLISALQPSCFVQLGVAGGDIYFGLCQLIREANFPCQVYGIDTWPDTASFEALSNHNNVHYRSFSKLLHKSFDEALPLIKSESIGLLYISGDQPFLTLKHVFASWVEKVQPGGVILLGNISVEPGSVQDGGAARMFQEVKSEFPHFEFEHNQGLGVLAKSITGTAIPFLSQMLNADADEQEAMRSYYALCASKLGVPETAFQVFRWRDNAYQPLPALPANPGVWTTLNLDLPEGTGDRALRLDVASRPAVVDIATLSLRKADGHTVWSWNPRQSDELRLEGSAIRLPEPEFFRILSFGNSSHLFLPEFSGAAYLQPLELEIRLRVDLELTALKELARGDARETSAAAATPLAIEAAVAKAKADSAKYLAQSRIEYDAKIRQISTESEARLEALRVELETLKAEMDALKPQLEEERANHQKTRLEKETLQKQQPLMLQEISIAQGNVEELKAELERVSGELATTEFDLTELRKLNARMAAALDEERSARMQMQESGSWQLTKPIRAVGDLFGPRKKY